MQRTTREADTTVWHIQLYTRLSVIASRPFLPIDDGLILNQLPLWVPDAVAQQRILVENPGRLFGF